MTYVFLFFTHGLPPPSALGGDFICTRLDTVLYERLLGVVSRLANIKQEGRRGRLLGYLEGIQASRCMTVRLLFRGRTLVLLWKLVHFVFHVGEVGQLVV